MKKVRTARTLFALLFFVAATLAPACARSEETGVIEPLISGSTHLLVFSPHPDDETLGASGLIQRVLEAGGKVKVVFMTSGDGFPEGVETENHITHPTAKDYRKYGLERREESLKADAELGVRPQDIIFLGFPDGGLTYLRLKFRAHPLAFRSPFTRESRPPLFECIIPDTNYTGLALTREVERIIVDFRPTVVATTPLEDQHPDHNATYYFIRDTLKRVNAKHPGIQPRFFTFLVHYGQWPIGQGAGSGARLNPPDGFPLNGRNWITLPLKPEEVTRKRKAILEYHSQMLVMGRFLLSFARSNELWLADNWHGNAKEARPVSVRK